MSRQKKRTSKEALGGAEQERETGGCGEHDPEEPITTTEIWERQEAQAVGIKPKYTHRIMYLLQVGV